MGLRYQLQGYSFLRRNMALSRGLPPILSADYGSVSIVACSTSSFAAFRRLHMRLRDGRDFNFWRQQLYRRRGDRLVFLACDGGQLVGFDMFYFREDEPCNVVHSAYIGVDERSRNQGISIALRQAAINHFSSARLASISSRIRSDNDYSLRSAERAGFEVVRTASPHSESDHVVLSRPLN